MSHESVSKVLIHAFCVEMTKMRLYRTAVELSWTGTAG